MHQKKAIFFDIDGTIWDRKNQIPDSTIEAIHMLQKQGHLAFICTGRTRGYIQNPNLLDIGFDGIVSGCGTMIEYHDQVMYYQELDKKLVEYTIETVREHGFRPILEGSEYLYMDPDEFDHDLYGQKLKRELGERLRTISDEWGKWEVLKLSCATDHSEREKCFEILAPYYDYMIHNSSVVEMVPKGHHKGTGIKKVCEYLNLDLKNTIAVGDSANDIGMLETAGFGVAMGNGSEQAKAAADYITTDLHEDGIWNACKHLGLIE